MCREREHSTGANGEPYRNTPSTRGQRGRCVLPRITTEVCSVEARGRGPLSQTHTHTHTHATLWTYLLPEVPPAPTAEECSRAEPVSTEGKGSELYPLPSGAHAVWKYLSFPPLPFYFPYVVFPQDRTLTWCSKSEGFLSAQVSAQEDTECKPTHL